MKQLSEILPKVMKRLNPKQPKRLKNLGYPTIATLQVLLGLARKTKKWYCYPSQDFILEKLQTYKYLKISKRCLNYHLAWLEFHGYIRRQRRFKRYITGVIKPMSTLYYFTNKAINLTQGQIKRALGFLKSVKRFKIHFFATPEIKPGEEDRVLSHEEFKARVKTLLEAMD